MCKMKIPCFILLFLLIMLPQGPGFPGTPENGVGDSHGENYRYEATPAGKENEREEIELALSFGHNGIGFSSIMVSAKSDEWIMIRMTEKGDLISADRTLRSNLGSLTKGRIWRDRNRAYLQRATEADVKTVKTMDIPEGATLALEGSLLVLLRFFPYGSAERWDLFLIDFSGSSMAATVRQTGVEHVAVPAGEFSRYRMEVLFHIPILSPKVVCWVTTEKPHVVVKSVGKRGIFTPKYITTLVGK
jgi:hypothetical protein